MALRRLIFDEATRSPEVGQHYYKIGPDQAYTVIESVLETHAHQSDFDMPTLAEAFHRPCCRWRVTLERQCAVRGAADAGRDRASSPQPLVDDFMKAFLKREVNATRWNRREVLGGRARRGCPELVRRSGRAWRNSRLVR